MEISIIRENKVVQEFTEKDIIKLGVGIGIGVCVLGVIAVGAMNLSNTLFLLPETPAEKAFFYMDNTYRKYKIMEDAMKYFLN